MAQTKSGVRAPSPEQRQVAVGQFERAKQVLVSQNYDYAIQLLLACCQLDPANLTYRQLLRQTEKDKYDNNQRGSRTAALTSGPAKLRLKTAKARGDHLKVIEHGEEILTGNPWDVGTQFEMARAADLIGLLDLAIWFMFQVRETKADDVHANRFLARLCEKRGNFKEAILLWEMVRKALPHDAEAQSKGKDLAASNTIARGGYEEAVSGKATGADDTVKESAAESAPRPAPGQSGPRRVPQEESTLLAQIQQDPAKWDLYLRLAALYRRNGDRDKARDTLEQGLGPTCNHPELTLALAEYAIDPLRRELALVDNELQARPQDEALTRARQQILDEINSRELDLYRRKVAQSPTDNGLRLELAIRCLESGQVDEAIRELQTVRADPRHQWRALLYLGHCFRKRNFWRLAVGNYEEALRKLPPREEAARKEVLYHLARGAAEEGDYHKAVERGFELANLDFTYQDIGPLLDEWQKRLKA
jgi:tetratricopeptide (TPR) repeat protein